MVLKSNYLTYEILKAKPLVNIIIPAWKEGKLFENLLLSIRKLTYPYLKVIINAGGNSKTVNTANSFRDFKDSIILRQDLGGKVKAINECLEYVSEGLVYIIDADCYLTDEILLRIVYPLINLNKDIVVSGVRPLELLKEKNIVKYIEINRRASKKRNENMQISANVCLNHKVIKHINKFPEGKAIGDGRAMEKALENTSYKVSQLDNLRGFIYTSYPDTIRKYFNQNIRWIENKFFFKLYQKDISVIFRFFLLRIISIYILIFPLFLLFNNIPFNIIFFNIGLIFISYFYIKKLIRTQYYKRHYNKEIQISFSLFFYILIIGYLYIDFIMNIYTLIEIILFGNKKLKKRKYIR